MVRAPRALQVVWDLSPGGAERMALALARETGGAVALVGAPSPGELPVEVLAGVPWVRGGRRRGRLGLRALARLVAAARAADVVHTHLWAGDVWGGLAARIAGKPWVRTAHNIDADEPAWKLRTKAALLGGADAHVAVSEAVARYAAEVERLPAHRVIYNGVDLSRFDPARRWPSAAGGRGLAVGRRVAQKGFDRAAAALPPGATLDVVGEGPWQPDTPGVRLHGRQEDVAGWLAQADWLVVPSRWEGFGLAAVEGLAAGTPVVATAVGGLPEVIGAAGLLVPDGPDDAVIAGLRDALARLMGDAALRAQLSAAGPRQAARFSAAATFAAYAQLYREVTGG